MRPEQTLALALLLKKALKSALLVKQVNSSSVNHIRCGIELTDGAAILIEGRRVNLRIAEMNDVSLVREWWGNAQYMGNYQDVVKGTLPEFEKIVLENTTFYLIEKDEAKIGHINGWMIGRTMAIGYALIPSERGKCYGTEAIQLMVDQLFLTKDIARIQASTDIRNAASQRALEKSGFVKEGTMRKYFYAKGDYRDHFLYSILREEWKEPKILTELKT